MALTTPIGSNPWLVSSTIGTQGDNYNLTLKTAGTLLDRNIDISIKASLTERTVSFTSTALAINSLTPSFSTNMTTSDSGTYYIWPNASTQTNSPKVSYTNSAGYVPAHTNAAAVTIASVSSTATGTSVYIPTANLTTTGGGLTASANAAITIGDIYLSDGSYYISAIGAGVIKRASVKTVLTSGYTPANTNTAAIAADTFSLNAIGSTKTIPAAAGTTTITGGTIKMNSPTTANVSFSTTAPTYSGIYIKAIAAQSAAITASAKITTAGYTPTNDSFSTSTKTISTSSRTYYITGVTLENNSTFDITIPNGAETPITLHFSVDGNGNTTISEGGV